MSLRGPRGGRTRARGSRRGRGRGGRVTTVRSHHSNRSADCVLTKYQWEWHNNYAPGPEVYDQLWHIRREPAVVTPFLPTDCPIQNARTRILDRRQTEGDIQRNFYVVEITYFSIRDSAVSSIEDAETSYTEIVHADLSRILEFTSPDQLERFENEQFQIEAEAEAVAARVEAEELARRRLEKNSRVSGTGQASRMLNGPGADVRRHTRGRPRGRSRGRGRGRGRGSGRGRGALTSTFGGDMGETTAEVEAYEAMRQEEEDMQLVIAETDSDEGELARSSRAQVSPNAARSAFVTNSALPTSPEVSHRHLSSILIMPRTYSEDDQFDPELLGAGARSLSVSSAGTQSGTEDVDGGRSESSSAVGSTELEQHTNRQQRTENPTSSSSVTMASPAQPRYLYLDVSPVPSVPETAAGSDAHGEYIHVQPQVPVHRGPQRRSSDTELDTSHVRSPTVDQPARSPGDNEDGDDAEEYVVEAIMEHYREAGKKFYLVKWEGYEDSHDWLPEEDLEGAHELVAEYNARIRKCKGKQKMKR
jgi:hypothetical protein